MVSKAGIEFLWYQESLLRLSCRGTVLLLVGLARELSRQLSKTSHSIGGNIPDELKYC